MTIRFAAEVKTGWTIAVEVEIRCSGPMPDSGLVVATGRVLDSGPAAAIGPVPDSDLVAAIVPVPDSGPVAAIGRVPGSGLAAAIGRVPDNVLRRRPPECRAAAFRSTGRRQRPRQYRVRPCSP